MITVDSRSDEPAQSARPRVETFGPDRVEIHDRRVVIHLPADMDRWDVVEHRKPLIRLEGRTWTLAKKNLVKGEWVRYELVPWEPANLERHGHEFDYGAEFVDLKAFDFVSIYRIPVWRSVAPWIKLQVRNLFNSTPKLTWDTRVQANFDGPVDADGIPTQFIKSPTYGEALSPEDYYPGREFPVSLGIRF